MDEQGLEGCFLFPTLGVGIEEALLARPRGRCTPCSTRSTVARRRLGLRTTRTASSRRRTSRLLDPDRAVAELEWALDATAPASIVMRAGPVTAPTGGRSPGDPVYDPFWARARRGRHHRRVPLGRRGLRPLRRRLGRGRPSSRRSAARPFRHRSPADRPISDTIAALVCHGVFDRYPNLRVATIESGSRVGRPLLQEAARSPTRRRPARSPAATRSSRSATHVWVSPYYEDDIRGLRRRPRRRPRALRLRLPPRRGPGRPDVVRRRPALRLSMAFRAAPPRSVSAPSSSRPGRWSTSARSFGVLTRSGRVSSSTSRRWRVRWR